MHTLNDQKKMETFKLKSNNFETISGVAVHKLDTRIRVTQKPANNTYNRLTDLNNAVIVTAHCFDNGVDVLEF